MTGLHLEAAELQPMQRSLLCSAYHRPAPPIGTELVPVNDGAPKPALAPPNPPPE